MKILFKTIACSLAIGLGVGLPANAELYKCKMRSQGVYPIIGEEVIFDINDKENRVMIADVVLAYYGQVPAAGKLKRYDEKRIVATWELEPSPRIEDRAGLSFTVNYKAVLRPKNMHLVISAWVDFDYTRTVRGKCVKTVK